MSFDVAAFDRKRILKAAKAALTSEPPAIARFPAASSEGGPNDFYSNADYWWPDSDGKKQSFIRRDGRSNPNNFSEHRLAMRAMRDGVASLAAAYKITGEDRYVARAVEFLRVFFLESTTRMNPNLDHAQTMPGTSEGRGWGVIDGLHLIEVPRAVEAMKKSRALSGKILTGLKQWFSEFIYWLVSSPHGKAAASTRNNHAVAYRLQLAIYARFVNETKTIVSCRRVFKEVFVLRQMAADGSFPAELARTKPYAYSIFQLDNMAVLCQALSTSRDDLWEFKLADGRGMRKAMDFMHPFLADKSKWPLKPDVQAWDGWPARQPSLLFAGLAYNEPRFLKLWKNLPPDPADVEVQRNIAITQPVLWVD